MCIYIIFFYLYMSLLVQVCVALHIGEINSLISGVNFYQFFVGFLIMYAGTAFPHRPDIAFYKVGHPILGWITLTPQIK